MTRSDLAPVVPKPRSFSCVRRKCVRRRRHEAMSVRVIGAVHSKYPRRLFKRTRTSAVSSAVVMSRTLFTARARGRVFPRVSALTMQTTSRNTGVHPGSRPNGERTTSREHATHPCHSAHSRRSSSHIRWKRWPRCCPTRTSRRAARRHETGVQPRTRCVFQSPQGEARGSRRAELRDGREQQHGSGKCRPVPGAV
jgi:hypothetical protein